MSDLTTLPEACLVLLSSVLMPIRRQHGAEGNPQPGGQAQELPGPCQAEHRALLLSFSRHLPVWSRLGLGRGRTEQDGEILEERKERPRVKEARSTGEEAPCCRVVVSGHAVNIG